jgi:YD repeat-containing protein
LNHFPTQCVGGNGVATKLARRALAQSPRGWVVLPNPFAGPCLGVTRSRRRGSRRRLQQSIVRGADNAVTTDDAITQYEVDARGNLTKLTTPDGIALTMVYDARDRLTTLRDASGNAVRYTLDSAGNRLTEEAFDAANVQRRVRSATFDAVNRLTQITGSTTTQRTVMTFDAAGRVTTTVDSNLVGVAHTNMLASVDVGTPGFGLTFPSPSQGPPRAKPAA